MPNPIEDTDNGLEIAGANNELVEDTNNDLEIVDSDNDLEEDTDNGLVIVDDGEGSSGEECNNVMFDYYKLGYVEMIYIEMNRQNIRIGEIGKKASEQVSDVVSKLESLGSIVDVGVSDCASNLANKITERTKVIQSSMEAQINAHVELNTRLERNLNYLDSLVDTLFDADGQQITWKSYLGEIESLSYQDKLNEYVAFKQKKDEYLKQQEEKRRLLEMGAISIEYLDNPVSMDIPNITNNTQSVESHTAVTLKTAECYDIIHGEGEYEGKVFVDEKYGIQYMIGEDGEKYYQVAMGSYYGETGDTFKVTFEDGTVVNVVKTDEKSDDDTIHHYNENGKDLGGWYHETSGTACILEYVADLTITNSISGFKGGFQEYEEFGSGSNIVSIEKTGSM